MCTFLMEFENSTTCDTNERASVRAPSNPDYKLVM